MQYCEHAIDGNSIHHRVLRGPCTDVFLLRRGVLRRTTAS